MTVSKKQFKKYVDYTLKQDKIIKEQKKMIKELKEKTKIKIVWRKRLSETEDSLYNLRDEMTDKQETKSPINPMIDWIQKELRK